MDTESTSTPTPAAAPGPIPTAGRIVNYRLNQYNADSIVERRKASGGLFVGNPVKEGDTFPLIITEAWGHGSPGSAVNGQVLLDGNDSLWLTSVMVGEGPGTFSWPVRS